METLNNTIVVKQRSIAIKPTTLDSLRALKIHPRETDNDVIDRLIKSDKDKIVM